MQLCGCHGQHFGAGFEILLGNGKRDPELTATPIGIDACANEEARFDFLFRLQKADVGDSRLVVQRDASAFPALGRKMPAA